MFLRNAAAIKHRAALRPMFYQKIANGKLHIVNKELTRLVTKYVCPAPMDLRIDT